MVAAICFGNVMRGELVYDDVWVIGKNPTLGHASELFKQFVLPYHHLRPETGLYRPLTLISFSLQLIWQQGPVGFHAANILLHALNTLLVFALVLRMFGARRQALIASTLFLLLPIHTEAVSSIVGRADLLATAFGLLSLLMVTYRRYWLSAISFAAALFAKESAVGVGPVLLVMVVLQYPTNYRRALHALLRYVPFGAAYALLRFTALRGALLANDSDFVINPLTFTDPVTRFCTALKVMLLYFWKSLVPIHLSVDYSFDQISLVRHLWDPHVVAGLLVLGVLVVFAASAGTRRREIGFAGLFFVSTYFVISNFVVPIGTIMAERTFYMPSIAVCLLIAAAFHQLMSWRYEHLWIGLLVLVCGYYGWRIADRNSIWINGETLYHDMLKESPRSVHAKTSVASVYIGQGKLDDAKALMADAYRQAPDHLVVLDTLGVIAEHEKRFADAEQFYLKAIALRPDWARGLRNLSGLYFRQQNYKASSDILWREFTYHPTPVALSGYAVSQMKLGNYDVAIKVITQYYGERPTDPDLRSLLESARSRNGRASGPAGLPGFNVEQ